MSKSIGEDEDPILAKYKKPEKILAEEKKKEQMEKEKKRVRT